MSPPKMTAPQGPGGTERRGEDRTSEHAKYNFTAESSQRAVEARRAAIAAGAHYRRDWLDAGRWDELAAARGIRLPQWHEAPTPGKLKFWLQTLVGEPFPVVYGDKMTPAKLIALNPDMPLRAFVGQMLEAAP